MVFVDNSAGRAFTAAMKRSVINAVDAALGRCTKDGGDVSVAIVKDAQMQRLNLEYRGIDAPTDVLSFAQNEGEALAGPAVPDTFWGDIAISLETAARQAAEYGHSTERELSFLAIHATLHLLGHDHENPQDDRHMQAMQTLILEKMGLQG